MGGPRPRRIFTMSEFEEWARTADPDHPLRRALLVARLALEAQKSSVWDFSKRTMQKVFRERRALLRTPETILSEFSLLFVKELAVELPVSLPSDEGKLSEMVSNALSRARNQWGRATESIARTARMPRGRPASIAIGALEILCEEILRSPLVSKRLKERVRRAVAAWAAQVAQSGFKGFLRGLQRVRQKSRSGK